MPGRSRRFSLIATGILLAAVSVAPADPEPPASPQLKALAQARFDAAVKQYEESWLYYRESRSESLPVYIWSRLVLDAQRDLDPSPAAERAALAEHRTRMAKLQEMVKRVNRLGMGRSFDGKAVEYYRAEADYWIARRKGP